VVVGASAASANTAAATSSAYSAGVAAGSANTAAAYSAGVATGAAAATAATAGTATTVTVSQTTYVTGAIYPTVPAGSLTINKNGTTYYLSGNTWFKPAYGANGVYYTVVPTP
jgi:hypothetical protein